MTGKQNAVLWIGLIIVIMNLISRWSDIKSVVFAGASGSSGVSSSNPSSGGVSTVPGIPAPSGGGVTIPFGGMPFTVPFLSTSATQPKAAVILYGDQAERAARL